MVTGRAARLGYLDIDDPIGDYIPEADGPHSEITIEEFLTQSSGLPLNWPNELSEIPPDTVRYTLGLSIEDEPGTDFEYGQTTVSVLAHTVEHAVGMDFQEFAQQELFDLIGIDRQDWFWRRDRAGNTHGWAYLYMTPKDMARLGHLMLHGGKWCNQRLLDKPYVEAASSPSDTNPFYGYLFWINEADWGYTVDIPDQKTVDRRLVESAPRDMYMFVGFQDQIIFVIPSLEMVVIRTGIPGNNAIDDQVPLTAHPGDWMHEFFRILMQAVQDKDISDPGPYEGETDFALDVQYFVDPQATAGAVGVGPSAPDDCNLVGCDGNTAYEGTVQSGEDAANTYLGGIIDGL